MTRRLLPCLLATLAFSTAATPRDTTTPLVGPDGDPPHLAGASGGAYLEILPDTRRTHDDPLVPGENFTNEPGHVGVLHYKVHVTTAGRYYVWVRAYSTGTEDNGLHVGLNGRWPASGQRMQWCEGKDSWRWESRQRTAQEPWCGGGLPSPARTARTDTPSDGRGGFMPKTTTVSGTPLAGRATAGAAATASGRCQSACAWPLAQRWRVLPAQGSCP
jgi:hypothetical protein